MDQINKPLPKKPSDIGSGYIPSATFKDPFAQFSKKTARPQVNNIHNVDLFVVILRARLTITRRLEMISYQLIYLREIERPATLARLKWAG